MDLPGAAPAGPAGEPEVDNNLGLGGYDAWEAPEMPERFEDVTLDSGLLPGAEEPAIGAGVSAKGPDRAAAQNGESVLTCFLEADAQVRQHVCVPAVLAGTARLPAENLNRAITLGASLPQSVPLIRKCKVCLNRCRHPNGSGSHGG